MPTSTIFVPYATTSSEFTWDVDGTERSLVYEDRFITFPELVDPLVITLSQMEWLNNEVSHWVEHLLRIQAPSHIVTPFDIVERVFYISEAPIDGLYDAVVEFELPTSVAIRFEHSAGMVTLSPRDEVRFGWPNIITFNDVLYDFTVAARTGVRPRLGASVVGPKGPQGVPGPSDPLIPWPVDSVMWRKDSTNPGTLIGGTWSALASNDTIPAFGGGAYWAWRRTA